MRINAYVNFNSECEAAFRFYEQLLDGKILMMSRFEDTPMANDVSAEMRTNIIHARMQIGDPTLPPIVFHNRRDLHCRSSWTKSRKPNASSTHWRRKAKSICR